jgi:thiosulfate reductase cytochrome b subunit
VSSSAFNTLLESAFPKREPPGKSPRVVCFWGGGGLNLRFSVAIWTTSPNASLIPPCDVTIPSSFFFLRWAPLCEHVHVFFKFSFIFFFFFFFLFFVVYRIFFERFRAGFGQK